MTKIQELRREYDDYMNKLQAVADSYGEVTVNQEDLNKLRKLTADIVLLTHTEAYSKAMDDAHWGSVYLG